jgi:hypothetical protein
MGGSEQVLTDAAALAARTQATVTYQIATALQSTIGSLLDPAYTLVGVVLLCMYTEFAALVLGVDVSIARRVLLAQLGLSLMGAVDYALVQAAATRHASFLLRTYSLCLPSVLGSISPVMLSNDYVQNAISSYVYQYAQNSQEMLRGIDFGAPPLYVCVLTIVMARHTAFAHIPYCSIFTYVFQGLRLLLVDVLTRSLWDSTLGAPKLVRTALSLGLVLAVDVLGLAHWGMLQNVRGYAVFKTAQQLNSIGIISLDQGSTCAVAVVLLCARSAAAHAHILFQEQEQKRGEKIGEKRGEKRGENTGRGGDVTQLPLIESALTTAAHSVADIVCVASINALLQDMMGGSASSSPLVRFLLVCVVAVMACTTQKLLAEAVQLRT